MCNNDRHESANKRYYYRTSDSRTGAALAVLDSLILILEKDIQDKTIDLSIWEGEDPSGKLVAERIDGEWIYTEKANRGSL